ncbi:hypothetical protein MK489_22625 [Myxococcota bacterium]|nr:hypothetical protein [Myxococcota bacterium]
MDATDEPEILFVQNAPTSTFSNGQLTLHDQIDTVYFGDRPSKLSGTLKTSQFLGNWDTGSGGFSDVNPNADLVCTSPDDGRVYNAVVTLLNPLSYENGDLTYEIERLSGTIPSDCESSSLFIDGGILRALFETCSYELLNSLSDLSGGNRAARSFAISTFENEFRQLESAQEDLEQTLEALVLGNELGAKPYLPVVAAPPKPAEYPTGVELHPEIPEVRYSAACLDDDSSTPCESDHSLELAMERKYWAILVNTDIDQMKDWTQESAKYAKASSTAYSARIHKLLAFGNIMIYQSYEPCNPFGLPYIVDAVEGIITSLEENASNPNAITFGLYILSFVEFLLEGWLPGSDFDGEATLQRMRQLALLYGPPSSVYNKGWGSEMRFVGLAGNISLLDSPSNPIQTGIDGFDDGNNWSALRVTSLAPFKQVGTQITLAEGYTALNQAEEADARFASLSTWLQGKNAPAGFVREIDAVRAQLLGADGLIETWKTPRDLFGSQIRQPFGPAEQSTACRMCHLGVTVPDNYYSWR